MTVINIPRSESGTIRVFAISRPMSDMARTLRQQTKTTLASTLLGHEVSDTEVELFALSDLTGVGLHGYLSQGYDIDQAALRADRRRLEALDGYVLLHFARVGAVDDVNLTPHSDLTLIGTYTEPKALHTAPPIITQAAEPYSGVTDAPEAASRSRVGSILTVAVALLIITLIWWIMR